MRQATTFVVGLAAVRISGFVPRLGVPTRTWPSFPRSTDVAPSSPPLLRVMASTPKAPLAGAVDPHEKQPQPQPQQQQRPWHQLWHRLWRRLDTIKSSGLKEEVQTAGLGQRIKNLHNPITYLVLSLLAGLRWEWCFRSPYYWFGVAFLIKWYRARYVFKIPVWDRQPNWNNIITSREQEKDLKAFTCKTCGSTIFIAKTREFFFEGDTGIGGLGCFSCGAKGKDNFIMDRDRIVEDVAEIDDYFEYERPLDFVSAAERRKLLKEAKGDEERANQLLIERTTASTETDASTKDPETAKTLTPEVIDVTPEEVPTDVGYSKDAKPEISKEGEVEPTPMAVIEPEVVQDVPKPPKPSKPPAVGGGDDLDLLGMDG